MRTCLVQPWPSFASSATLLVFAACLSTTLARAAEPHTPFQMLGSLSCSSVSCHGAPPASTRPRLLEEFLRWMNFDPHSRSRETLHSERYQRIIQRLVDGGPTQTTTSLQARCAKCHDPASVPGDAARGDVAAPGVGQGIGCESCHGNAEKWISRHYERGIQRSELASLGMIDTKNLTTRATRCAGCHVGSPEQDVDHDLIAAGHPPLRFELASYHDLMKHKHWDDGRERLKQKDFQVQLWAAGQTAGALARLDLLASRSDTSENHGQPVKRWPELAEFNCFSCHQQIRPTHELLLQPRSTGLPAWSRWNLTFAGPLHLANDKPAAFQSLRDLFDQKFPADRARVKVTSDFARQQLAPTLPGPPLTGPRLARYLSVALRPENDDANDWETRSQQFLALVVLERTYRDELAKAQFQARLTSNEYNRRLAAEQALIAELTKVRGWLEFGAGTQNGAWHDEPVQFPQHREEIGRELKVIADQLLERVSTNP